MSRDMASSPPESPSVYHWKGNGSYVPGRQTGSLSNCSFLLLDWWAHWDASTHADLYCANSLGSVLINWRLRTRSNTRSNAVDGHRPRPSTAWKCGDGLKNLALLYFSSVLTDAVNRGRGPLRSTAVDDVRTPSKAVDVVLENAFERVRRRQLERNTTHRHREHMVYSYGGSQTEVRLKNTWQYKWDYTNG